MASKVQKRLTEKLETLRIWPTTKTIIELCAAAEGVTQVQLVDTLLIEHVMSRGLQDSIAGFTAHVERAEAERLATRKKLYKALLGEVKSALRRERSKQTPNKGMTPEQYQAMLKAQEDQWFNNVLSMMEGEPNARPE